MKRILIIVSVVMLAGAVWGVAGEVFAASEATQSVKLENPLARNLTPAETVGLFIKAGLGVVGGLTLVLVVYGGFQWLTAAGNQEKIASGSKTMLWAVVGLVLVLGSYLLVNAVLDFLGNRGT